GLQSNIDPLVKSTCLQPGGDGLLIIVFDEDNGSEGNHVACVIVSPLIASTGFKSSNSYKHQNALKLMAAALGLNASGLGAAASAANMSEFFHAVSTPGVVSLSPTSVPFGSVLVGATSAAQAVTLHNGTTSSASISSIAISGTNASAFAQTHTCGSSLAAGASCTISVTFTPTTTGTRTGTVTVNDSATGSPQKVSLSGSSGTGTPAASLSPTSLSFGNQTVGAASAAQVVTLKNTGTATATI